MFKVGPIAITSNGSAPNAAAAGPSGNLKGETWLDSRTAFNNPVLKVYNGSEWKPTSGFNVEDSSGNFSLAKTLTVSTLVVNGTGTQSYLRLPSGPTADQTTIAAAAGMVRFDNTLNKFRGYNGTDWTDLSSGDLTSLDVTGNADIGGNLTVDGNTTLGDDKTGDTLTVNAVSLLKGPTEIGTASTDGFSVLATSAFKAAVRVTSQNELRFHAGDTSSNYVALKAPASIAQSKAWVLPNVDGANGAFLKTDGSGNLSWASRQGPPVQEFLSVVATDYDITVGSNALSVGPVQINSGITVTVPADSRYTII